MLLQLPYAPPLVVVPAPVFDAVGAGSTGLTASQSWAHTASAGADAFAFGVYLGTPTVTYAGSAMTLVTSFTDGSGATHGLWKITSVPGGPQTVAASTTGSVILGNTVSVTGVNTIGTPATTSGTGGTASQTITCAANQLILQSSMDAVNALASATSGGTSQWVDPNNNESINTATVSTTFTISLGVSTDPWNSIGVVIS